MKHAIDGGTAHPGTEKRRPPREFTRKKPRSVIHEAKPLKIISSQRLTNSYPTPATSIPNIKKSAVPAATPTTTTSDD
ncbi:hypothetical protein ACFQL1_06875 [Halomicroarcula sp. GCM10025709]|uniref:hypothetical protein n=1 Tax=Haloarcula pelagica TaxID=3033389 RepID=UPI0024C26051|nr:hypothetical protein [Halomicroarcula sp. YJ-61-S]